MNLRRIQLEDLKNKQEITNLIKSRIKEDRASDILRIHILMSIIKSIFMTLLMMITTTNRMAFISTTKNHRIAMMNTMSGTL